MTLGIEQRWTNALTRSAAISVAEVVASQSWQRVFVVQSASQANLFYQVIVTGQQLQCSCPAGMHNIPCKHAAAVAQKIGLVEAEQVFAKLMETR